MSTKYIVNNLSGQTINGNPIDPTYKVFTALLTQSGGDNSIGVSGEGGTINIGVTYIINENPNNDDLTIYGAPNNNVGTYFVANQTGILNYTDFLQLVYNSGAPRVTVLENTIGNVWFTYTFVGAYGVNSNSLFPEGKVYGNISQQGGYNVGIEVSGGGSDSVRQISTYDNGVLANNLLGYNALEIRVYN